jgi:histidyl-tRNA synthetase
MGGGSFKSQLKRADKSQAICAIIIGEEEMENNRVGFKPLRNNEDQINVSFEDISDEVKKIFG